MIGLVGVLLETLIDAGLSNEMIGIIMKCIESTSLSVMWNGS